VLETVARLRAAGVWVEVSTPLIPGTTTDPDDLRAVADRLAAIDPDLPWHLLRFTPVYRMQDADPSAPDALAAARAIGHSAGLRYVYVERALGPEGRNTRCPRCRLVLVRRAIWETLDVIVTADGRCPSCAAPAPGRWRG
jgi:pyruvate formate lyase activating enzyme